MKIRFLIVIFTDIFMLINHKMLYLFVLLCQIFIVVKNYPELNADRF
ncbi:MULTISPECIES: hypothetical protein [unclassified Pedobacter]|nr:MULTISPECIES: hypothetical protein [unclassified Pedobacter]